MTPRSIKKRVENLREAITYNGFIWTRRGLFEKHKIIVSTMLCLRILIRDNKLDE